ncbi:unnamed protein product [Thelazia callipaeda]|uniref:ANK_REP_REGION domain-containing protein n=1 Tax=Thelazia callipaeda TaxID=103827 RepID=A0A0N5CTL8_THECL|nr:unnamed protein product [Thelazia callipaeda]
MKKINIYCNFDLNIAIFQNQADQLLCAICCGDVERFERLANSELISLSRHPTTFTNSLHLAVIHEQQHLLKPLLQLAPQLLDEKDSDGRTALHYAARLAADTNSISNSFQILLENGAKQQIMDAEGYIAENYKRTPQLMDIELVKRINMFPCERKDDIDELINDKQLETLEEIILSGNYWQLEDRIYPAKCQDIHFALDNLMVHIIRTLL